MAAYSFGGMSDAFYPTMTLEQHRRAQAKTPHPITWKPSHYTTSGAGEYGSDRKKASHARAQGAQPDSSNRPTTRMK